MRDGVIDVDVATPADRGFFGIQFRIASDGKNAEWVYLRPHKSGLPDAMQYRKLYLGYSDDVSVFLNGRILYLGRSA